MFHMRIFNSYSPFTNTQSNRKQQSPPQHIRLQLTPALTPRYTASSAYPELERGQKAHSTTHIELHVALRSYGVHTKQSDPKNSTKRRNCLRCTPTLRFGRQLSIATGQQHQRRLSHKARSTHPSAAVEGRATTSHPRSRRARTTNVLEYVIGC